MISNGRAKMGFSEKKKNTPENIHDTVNEAGQTSTGIRF